MALIGIASAPQAGAYAKTGCRFNTRNIGVVGTNTPSSYASALAGARIDWNRNTDINISSSHPTRIALEFNQYGNTGWSGTAEGAFECYRGYHTSGKFVLINRTYADPWTLTMKKALIGHEIGHQLGLAHTGSNSTSCSKVTLMNHYPSRWRSCGVYSPRTDDRNGINALY